MNNLNQMYNIPENIHVQLSHLHKGNSSRRRRRGKDYVTVVKFLDDDVIVAKATAQCNHLDIPNRKRGRDIAIGRAKKQYDELLNDMMVG